MTLTVLERDRTHIGGPRLAPAIGQARLTAGVRPDMLTASWDDHVGVYGEPHTWSRAAQVMTLLQTHSVLGRGGAGFPLAIKMDAVMKAKGRPVVVVNASEGEPAIWKDRTLLSLVPHLVLDGAQLAALAVGADRIHVAVNPEYRPAHLALIRAIGERQARTRDAVPVTVHVVPDEFTAGECSSVIGLINGGRGRPEFTSTIAGARGGAVGAGLIAPLAANACPLSEVSRVVGYLASQTAGQCGPCVNGLPTIAQGLAALAHGTAGEGMLDRIAEWSGLVVGRGVCKHPDGTVGFVASALEVFAEHAQRHLYGPCGLPWRKLLPVSTTDADSSLYDVASAARLYLDV